MKSKYARFIGSSLLAGSCFASAGCSDHGGPPEGASEAVNHTQEAVSGALLQQRTDIIKVAASARGITNALMIAGVGYEESLGLNQCWSEATWACQGPASPDCGGGPVIAGAGDGACYLGLGGLGMFQFDAGNHAQTLQTYGSKILTVQGNAEAAVDLILSKIWYSTNTPIWTTTAQEIAWINSIRIATPDFETWLSAITTSYNGCGPTCPTYSSSREKYRQNTQQVHDLLGDAYWYGGGAGTGPGTDGGQVVSSTAPTSMPPGAARSLTVQVVNQGTSTWTQAGHYRLGALGSNGVRWSGFGCGGYSTSATDQRVELCNDVPPGGTATFNFTITAPTGGTVTMLGVQMVHESVGWFGSTASLPIALSGAPACSCGGGATIGNKPIPASDTYCGFEVCGGDDQLYACQSDGWHGMGGSPCNCSCAGGTDSHGNAIKPEYTYCGYSVCGADHQHYVCGGGGWVGQQDVCP